MWSNSTGVPTWVDSICGEDILQCNCPIDVVMYNFSTAMVGCIVPMLAHELVSRFRAFVVTKTF